MRVPSVSDADDGAGTVFKHLIFRCSECRQHANGEAAKRPKQKKQRAESAILIRYWAVDRQGHQSPRRLSRVSQLITSRVVTAAWPGREPPAARRRVALVTGRRRGLHELAVDAVRVMAEGVWRVFSRSLLAAAGRELDTFRSAPCHGTPPAVAKMAMISRLRRLMGRRCIE